MERRRVQLASPVLIAAAVGAIFYVNAGQLNPPAGPVNPTGPTTLNQQDAGSGPLFSINTSGSFILTSDIVAPAGYTGDGIAILADNVTLNMNGFAVIGVAGSQRGIRIDSHCNISIYGGTVRDWGGDGVDAGNACNSQFSNLRVYQNGGVGLRTGSLATIRDCVVQDSGGDGIGALVGSTVIGCVASSNDGDGIDGGSTISACSAFSNGGDGIKSQGVSTISGCSASFNTGDGIRSSGLLGGSNINACTTAQNGGDGIEASNSLIIGNSSTSNIGQAINDTGGSLLVNNDT